MAAMILHSRIFFFPQGLRQVMILLIAFGNHLDTGQFYTEIEFVEQPFLTHAFGDTAPFIERRSCVLISFNCSLISIFRLVVYRRQWRVILAVTQHLLYITFTIIHSDIRNISIIIRHQFVFRIHKTFVRSQIQFLVTFQYFSVKNRIYFHSIIFYQCTRTLKVTGRLDTLISASSSPKSSRTFW